MTFGVPGNSVTVEGFDVIGPHNPSNTMRATGLASFSQVEKDARGVVDTMALRIGCPDQAEQPADPPTLDQIGDAATIHRTRYATRREDGT